MLFIIHSYTFAFPKFFLTEVAPKPLTCQTGEFSRTPGPRDFLFLPPLPFLALSSCYLSASCVSEASCLAPFSRGTVGGREENLRVKDTELFGG